MSKSSKQRLGMSGIAGNTIGWIVIVVIIIGGGSLIVGNSLASLAGEEIEDQGALHYAEPLDISEYSSNPPTSGTHAQSPAPWGITSKETPVGELIHSMEHGGIIVYYQDVNNEELKKELASIVLDLRKNYNKIIMVPYPDMDYPVAMTSWTRLLNLDGVDKEAIDNFVFSNYGKSPEGGAN